MTLQICSTAFIWDNAPGPLQAAVPKEKQVNAQQRVTTAVGVALQVVAAVHQQRGGWDCPRLASHLERLAGKGQLGEGWQLALDMYTRLGMHDRHCHMLISKVSLNALPQARHADSLLAVLCGNTHQLTLHMYTLPVIAHQDL